MEHVMAHRAKKEKKDMSHFEKFVTEGNEKADELAKEGALLDEGFMAEAITETLQQEREEVYVALQYAASFHCLAEQWKDCEELEPKPKEKWIFIDKKSEENEASNGVVCGSRQVSMYEMWKRKQIHKDAWQMHQTNTLVKKCGNGEGVIWEVMIWSEEWTDREKL